MLWSPQIETLVFWKTGQASGSRELLKCYCTLELPGSLGRTVGLEGLTIPRDLPQEFQAVDFMKRWPKIPLLNSKVKSMTVGSSGDLSGVAALVPQLCKFTKKKKKVTNLNT